MQWFFFFLLKGSSVNVFLPFMAAMVVLTNTAYLPYLVLRPYHRSDETPVSLEDVPVVEQQLGESKGLLSIYGLAGLYSIFWTFFGRPEFGGLTERWASFTVCINTYEFIHIFARKIIYIEVSSMHANLKTSCKRTFIAYPQSLHFLTSPHHSISLPLHIIIIQELASTDRLMFAFTVELFLFWAFQGNMVADDCRRRGVDPNAPVPTLAKIVPFLGLLFYFLWRPPLPSSRFWVSFFLRCGVDVVRLARRQISLNLKSPWCIGIRTIADFEMLKGL